MKAVSLSLKIVALLAAAFCVFAWLDTRKKISTAEEHMKGVPGATLSEKAPKIAGYLKDIVVKNEKIKAFEGRVRTLEERNQSVNSELESERAKSVQSNADIVKKNSEIRMLNTSVAGLKKQISGKDNLIENLKREIVSTKSMMTQNNESDALKEKVSTLESQLATKSKALEEAEVKLKVFEQAEVVTVIDTDADGKKVQRKIVKVPYVATGDIATVLKVDFSNAIMIINRGEKTGVKNYQKILLKRDGKLVSEITITDARDDFSVAMFNPKSGLAETLEVGDLLEMVSPVVAEKADTKAAPASPVAPKSDEQKNGDDNVSTADLFKQA